MMYTKLKYDKFEKYLYKVREESNLHYIFKFDNGYGASVVKNIMSYGHAKDLFELAVIEFIDEFTWKICCSTDITDDVIGYLTNDDVLDLLERIKNLWGEMMKRHTLEYIGNNSINKKYIERTVTLWIF